jgi:hypothetical protein
MMAVAAILALGLAAEAQAGPVSAGMWYQYCFGAAGSFAGSNAGCAAPYTGVAAADDPAWTYSSTGTFFFRVQDLYLYGDRFTLFANAVAVGTTSAPGTSGGCGNNPAACAADGSSSGGTFVFGPGSYAFTIRADDSPYGGGAGAFRIEDEVSPVPEPATVGLMALGLVAVGAARRRKQS